MTDPYTHLGYRPCVGIMVLNKNSLVWVGQRPDNPGDAEGRGVWWQMPQGGIDEGEDPHVAAIRELKEETGIYSVELLAETKGWLTYDLPPDLLGKAWGGKYRGQKQKWFAVRFNGNDSEVNITPDNPNHIEFVRWRWSPPGELLECIVPFKRGVYAEVLQEFGFLFS